MSALAQHIHKLTADQVVAMAEAGILDEDAHIELLDGVLVDMSPQGIPHAGVVSILTPALTFLYARLGVTVRVQLPLQAGDHDLPEPDIAVVRGAPREWLRRNPDGPDALLLIEVADSSRARDHEKAFLYARAGVPVYWIVDVPARVVHVHTAPTAEGYEQVDTVLAQGQLTLPELTDTLEVAELLP